MGKNKRILAIAEEEHLRTITTQKDGEKEQHYAIVGFKSIDEAQACALRNGLDICVFGREENREALVDWPQVWDYRYKTSRGIPCMDDDLADMGYEFYDKRDLFDLCALMQEDITTTDDEENKKAAAYYTAVINAVINLESSNKEVAVMPGDASTITVLDQYTMYERDDFGRALIVGVA